MFYFRLIQLYKNVIIMIVSNINYIILYYENCIVKIFCKHYFRLIQISKNVIIIIVSNFIS